MSESPVSRLPSPVLSLYFHMLGVRLKAQMQYRASFWMETVSMFFISALDFIALSVLFARFPSLRGWSLWEVGVLYALVQGAFALAELAGRGFDTFARQIRQGTFDNLLIRPCSPFFLTLAGEFQARRIARLAQAILVAGVSAAHLGIAWTPDRLLFAGAALAGGACFFLGLFILGATICFWTVESIEIINIFTHGGIETANLPISIYRDWFRGFFIFVVPLAWVNYFPALRLIGRPDPLGFPPAVQLLAPLVGVAFLLLCRQVWEFGVRHYQSTGS